MAFLNQEDDTLAFPIPQNEAGSQIVPASRIVSSLLFVLVLVFSGSACSPSTELIDQDDVFTGYDWWDSRDFAWYSERIPFIETPDDQINEIYYYRWEVMKTHLTYGSPETGYMFTEFMDRPFWSGTYGGISCPLGHQLSEVRWLKDARIIDDFARYWIDTDGAKERNYSNWYGYGIWHIHEVWGDSTWAVSMLPYMEEQLSGWMDTNWDADHGLFYKSGHDDGMEININSRQTSDDWTVEGYRPTLNSYLYGDLMAMAQVADLAGDTDKRSRYSEQAQALKQRVVEELWDADRQFFFHQFKGDHPPGIKDKSLTYETGPFAGHPNGRELMGYVPWQFHLPDEEHAAAWQFLMDENHFRADYGPTTVSQSDTLFMLTERCCVWSGQSWPYATTQTLAALANVLQSGVDAPVTNNDYTELLQTYTRTQYKDGRPYIAESANPYTGSWFGNDMPNHSEHYSHSGYVDLVISGLLGIIPRANGLLLINPLTPEEWDWFAAEGLRLHGHDVDVVWDRDGSKYGLGAGLRVRIDNREVASRETMGRLEVVLPEAGAAMTFERPHNLAVNNGTAFPEITASFSDPAHPPFWAADGGVFFHKVPTTRWTTEGSSSAEDWIQADFGALQTVETVVLHFLDDGVGVVPPSSYRIELLQDGAWLPAEVRSRIPGSPTGRRANISLIGPVDAEGVRVTFEHAEHGKTGLAELEVWTPNGARVHPAVRSVSNKALNMVGDGYPRMTASFPAQADVGVLQDGQFGLTTYQSNRWVTRDSPNQTDWVRVDFEAPEDVREAEVYLWGNAPRSLGRVDSTMTHPVALRREYLQDGEWVAVRELSTFPDKPMAMARNIMRFDPVRTTSVRVLFDHADGAFSGATEIIVR